MTSALIRKAQQVLDDPVLRRWLMRRAVGLEKSPPAFTAGAPPYLAESTTPIDGDGAPRWTGDIPGTGFQTPEDSIEIDLPGETVGLSPDIPGALFDRHYRDLETRLAAHRFAWVPLAGPAVDADWVAALWTCWVEKFGDDETGWPWHPYTAAERAINIIDFSRRFGLPGSRDDTLHILSRHGSVIRANLEYFGEHYTSNHLSNNGRGLLRIGTALGLEDHAATGAKIMIAEAGRIFGRSGILREGSTHYHLLLTRNYIDAWADAGDAGLPQTGTLRDIAVRALTAVPGICLPGGMPLIGDISPDVPPGYLRVLTGGDHDSGSWPDGLPAARRDRALELIAGQTAVSPDRLAEDGWHRFSGDAWHALAYVPPDGWPPMPGHGHHDLGSFELHDGDIPIIIDPGRGSYADRTYETAEMHNGLTIDGRGATPENRPYYAAGFRDRILRRRPEMVRTRTGSKLRHWGYRRAKGDGETTREWRFTGNDVEILDRIEGGGTHRVCRRFFVPGTATLTDVGALLTAGGNSYRLTADVAPTLKQATRWSAYGDGKPGTLITLEQTAEFPFESRTTIERR